MGVRCFQNLRQGVTGARRRESGGNGEQEDIVIAENRQRGGAEITNVAQNMEGVRAPVDEIADKPQPVLLRIKVKSFCELSEGSEAALNVADCISSHGWAKTSADRRGSQVRNRSASDASGGRALQELARHCGASGLVRVCQLGQQAGSTVEAGEASLVFQFFAVGCCG